MHYTKPQFFCTRPQNLICTPMSLVSVSLQLIYFAALKKNRVKVHPYLPIVTTPLQWPLSSFPKVAVWRGLTAKFILLYCTYLPDLVELSTWMFVLAICVNSSLPWQTTNEGMNWELTFSITNYGNISVTLNAAYLIVKWNKHKPLHLELEPDKALYNHEEYILD